MLVQELVILTNSQKNNNHRLTKFQMYILCSLDKICRAREGVEQAVPGEREATA